MALRSYLALAYNIYNFGLNLVCAKLHVHHALILESSGAAPHAVGTLLHLPAWYDRQI